jgi:hypothetical protein
MNWGWLGNFVSTLPLRGRIPRANDAALLERAWLGTGSGGAGTKFLRDDGTWSSTLPTFQVNSLVDSNGNEILTGAGVASAVNEVTLTNAATGSSPKASTTGGDSNVGLDVEMKGAGRLRTGDSGGIPRDVVWYLERQPRFWLKNPGEIMFTNVGMIAAPMVNTNSLAASADTTTRCYVSLDTMGVTSSACGVISAAFTYVRRAFSPTLVWPLRTQASIANSRIWMGFFSASPDAFSSPTTVHVAAFRYATDVDGTAFWRCVTCDGASNVTTTTTTKGISSATEYHLRIEMTSSAVAFYVDHERVALHSTNLPGNTTTLGLALRMVTLDMSVKGIRASSACLLHA